MLCQLILFFLIQGVACTRDNIIFLIWNAVLGIFAYIWILHIALVFRNQNFAIVSCGLQTIYQLDHLLLSHVLLWQMAVRIYQKIVIQDLQRILETCWINQFKHE